ncbi:hypothetical protein ACFXG4_04015 [Nocardia sp. NPDC059246]|uniref:hypothetical protein n=1 Tax=unclassified Nocardia TaxID=2637762 RepID=UPI003690EF73
MSANQGARISVTQRPSTAALLEEMVRTSGMTKGELFNVGVDVLHFMWSALRAGGEIGVKLPSNATFQPVVVLMPGLHVPTTDEPTAP